MLKANNEVVLVDIAKEFNLEGKVIDGLRDILVGSICTTERVLINKRESDIESLEKILEFSKVSAVEFLGFIKEYAKDEYLSKFKELEFDLGYKLYDNIRNSKLSDKDKLEYEVSYFKNQSENNLKRDKHTLMKISMLLLAAVAGMATLGRNINEFKDSQWTRRIKAKYKK